MKEIKTFYGEGAYTNFIKEYDVADKVTYLSSSYKGTAYYIMYFKNKRFFFTKELEYGDGSKDTLAVSEFSWESESTLTISVSLLDADDLVGLNMIRDKELQEIHNKYAFLSEV